MRRLGWRLAWWGSTEKKVVQKLEERKLFKIAFQDLFHGFYLQVCLHCRIKISLSSMLFGFPI